MKLKFLLAALLLCAAQIVSAAIYTYIDANGERVFTDNPPKSQRTETIEIGPSNQMSAPAAVKLPPVYQADPAPLAIQYQVLRILVPEPDATIRANDRQLIVTVNSEPALLEGHHYRLILDGSPLGEPSRSPVFPLTEIDRGTHQLAVEIINQQGAVLERTPSQPFHLRQSTLSDKRRVRPCEKDDYGVRPECPLKDKPKEKRSLIPFL
ncbi:MAG: DUF4124 domain-containing protein [Pseudomonas sp.]|jgi:hypothetical protein|nr:DUF4124 domain-containing protein [Pseudomonas sp.]